MLTDVAAAAAACESGSMVPTLIVVAIAAVGGVMVGASYARELYELRAAVGAWLTGMLCLAGVVAVGYLALHFWLKVL